MIEVSRRTLLGAAAGYALAPLASVPIIDGHIHLFDQTRPQGVPYSGPPENKEPALPPRYRRLASPLGIVGAIAVEASPWVEDNLWLLEAERNDPMMIGAIGNLRPEWPEFGEYLDRFHKNRLFLGIRYGNLWSYDLAKQIGNPSFIEGLKLLQQAGLVLDTANPTPTLMEAVIRVNDRVPELRIVIDHLPVMLWRLDAKGRTDVEASLRELAKRPSVYIKVSELMRMEGGRPALDPALYRPVLDYLFHAFGEDKLIFGSDWPNGTAMDSLPAIVKIVQDYFTTKGRQAAEKYFWKNSVAAYRWLRRDAGQPAAAA
jgi:predicted TIM-barrel fold metal-dependent hydrolase